MNHTVATSTIQTAPDGMTAYAMCDTCGLGLESWLIDEEDTGYTWTRFGVYVGSSNAGHLDARCNA